MSGQGLSFAHLIRILLLSLISEDKAKCFCRDCSSDFINALMNRGVVSYGGGEEIFTRFIYVIIC